MLSSESQQTLAIIRPKPEPVVVKENRRIQRIALALPARVEVKVDANLNWDQITRLNDFSAFGAGFMLKRPVRRGVLFLMTVPMTREAGAFASGQAKYR